MQLMELDQSQKMVNMMGIQPVMMNSPTFPNDGYSNYFAARIELIETRIKISCDEKKIEVNVISSKQRVYPINITVGQIIAIEAQPYLSNKPALSYNGKTIHFEDEISPFFLQTEMVEPPSLTISYTIEESTGC